MTDKQKLQNLEGFDINNIIKKVATALLTLIILASFYSSNQNSQPQGQIASGVVEYSQ